MSYTPRLKTQYKEEIIPSLKEKFAYTSVMEVPKIQKICLNQGVGDAVSACSFLPQPIAFPISIKFTEILISKP